MTRSHGSFQKAFGRRRRSCLLVLCLLAAASLWSTPLRSPSPVAFDLRDAARTAALRLFDKDHDGKIQFEEVEATAKDALHHVEGFVESIRNLPRLPKRVLDTAGGTLMLLYGRNFASSTLFFQAFRATGWPVVQRAAEELSKSYAQARDEAKRQMPQLLKTRELIPQLLAQKKEAENTFKEMRTFAQTAIRDQQAAEKELTRAVAQLEKLKEQSSVNAADVKEAQRQVSEATNVAKRIAKTVADGEAMRVKASASMDAIRASYDQAIASTNSLKAIADAVEPEHLADCARGVGTGLVSCIAAARAPLARAACVGADLGEQLAQKLSPLVNNTLAASSRVPPSFAKWGACLTSSACTAGMAYAAFQLQEVTLTVAACALGAKTVTNAISRQLNESLGGVDLKDIRVPNTANLTAAGALEMALTAGGVYSQVRPGGGGASLPGLIKTLLAPFLGFEAYLRASALAGAASGAAAKAGASGR